MALDDTKRACRNDLLLASALVAAGLLMTGVALMQLSSHSPVMAQATPPLQSSPPSVRDNAPADAKPGRERPSTPRPPSGPRGGGASARGEQARAGGRRPTRAPEPARPDAQAQTEGAKAALPP